MTELPDFNLEYTARVDALCKVPKDQRDESWRHQLFQFLPTASMATGDKQVFSGPDGFPYFDLHLPVPNQPFNAVSLAAVLEHVTENGFGIALNAVGGSEPDWVFTMGDLWNFRETKEFVPPLPRWQNDSKPDGSGVVEKAREILIGQPSETYLPSYVRRILNDTLQNRFGVDAPSVFLMEDPALNPSQNLVFNVFPETLPDPRELEYARRYLSWAVPRDYGLIGIPKDSELTKHFMPLVS